MKHTRKILVLFIVIMITLAGCHFPGRPWVLAEITSHKEGDAVVLNEEVRIITHARSSQGIDNVKLYINGILENTNVPPIGQPQEHFADQPWTPSEEGQAIISVMSFDRRGNASEPFSVILQVVPSIHGGETEPTPTPTISPEELAQTQTAQASCTNSAAFIEHVTIPINAYVSANSNFTKIWRVTNDGTCEWNGYKVVHTAGELMEADSPKTLPLVKAGSNANIVVDMVAPSKASLYSAVWRLQSSDGIIFGPDLVITINVQERPTNTPTPTATFTRTPTQTPSFTATSTPTRTFTPIPTATFTSTSRPTLTSTPRPTSTATPKPTSTATPKPTITASKALTFTATATSQPIGVEQFSEQITIVPNATSNTTVTCPGGSVVVSGGFTHQIGIRVWHSMKDGNGWRVYADNTPGGPRTLTVYAVCLSNSGGISSHTYTQQNANANATTQLSAACPSGSMVTGGGWVLSTNEKINIVQSSKSGNGWQIRVENTGDENPLITAYAVCLSGVTGSTSQETSSGNTIPANDTANVQQRCPSGTYITGGGFNLSPGLTLYNTSKYLNGWINYVSNTTSLEKNLDTFAICYSP